MKLGWHIGFLCVGLTALLIFASGCALQRNAIRVYVQPVGAPHEEVERLVSQLRAAGYDASAIDVPTAPVAHTVVIYGPDEQTYQQALRICRLLTSRYDTGGAVLRAGHASNHNYTSRHIGILLMKHGEGTAKRAGANCDR